MQEVRIIKLGGSVVSREDCAFDFEYIKKFKEILLERIELGEKFCIVVGGGYTCRNYQRLARESATVSTDRDLHWIGTTVNVLHAELIRAAFSEYSPERPVVYEEYYDGKPISMDKPILLGGGGRPGHSGDMDAILLGLKVGAKKIISLKNIDYLYDSDPKKNPAAKIVKQTNWDGYFEILGGKQEHEPGGNYVVDPKSAKKAKEEGVEFVIMKGSQLDNFEAYLKGENFDGSLIE
jgi:predicted uridylate kinase